LLAIDAAEAPGEEEPVPPLPLLEVLKGVPVLCRPVVEVVVDCQTA
jgi:hypothetical protein